MAKVSVIIPAYNEEKYIKRCLDSAINQDLDDIEVIAINDGSTDNTLSIMREYENKNVKVFDQNNHGAGYARNMGLLGAQGEYIQFLDADDYLQPGALKKLYTLGKKHDADIVKMGAQTRVGPIKLGDYTYIGKLEDGIVDKTKNPNYMVECLSTIWDKFTKHDLLEGVKFPLYPSWKDLGVTPYLLAKADTIYHTNDKLYNYQMMFNTTVRNTFKMNKRLTDVFRILDHVKELLIKDGLYELYESAFEELETLHIIFRISDVLTWINVDNQKRQILLSNLLNILNIRCPHWRESNIIHERKDPLFQNAVRYIKSMDDITILSEEDSIDVIDTLVGKKKSRC